MKLLTRTIPLPMPWVKCIIWATLIIRNPWPSILLMQTPTLISSGADSTQLLLNSSPCGYQIRPLEAVPSCRTVWMPSFSRMTIYLPLLKYGDVRPVMLVMMFVFSFM